MTNSENNKKEKNVIWKLLESVLNWRRLLILNTFLATLITFIVMLFFPNWYSASTKIMPPDTDSGMLSLASGLLPAGMGALLGGGGGFSLPGLASPSELYAASIKSDAVSMAVIEKNNLTSFWLII